VVAATAAGAIIVAAWAAIQASPYLTVLREFPGARRSLAAATFNSPPAIWYLSAPNYSLAWGHVTEGLRNSLPWAGEQTMFPGATVLVLASWGLVKSRHRLSLRLGLLAGAFVFGLLALGFRLLHGDLGYRFLWLHAPGWSSTRTPGRIVTFALLALAVLGGLGGEDLLRRLHARRSL